MLAHLPSRPIASTSNSAGLATIAVDIFRPLVNRNSSFLWLLLTKMAQHFELVGHCQAAPSCLHGLKSRSGLGRGQNLQLLGLVVVAFVLLRSRHLVGLAGPADSIQEPGSRPAPPAATQASLCLANWRRRSLLAQATMRHLHQGTRRAERLQASHHLHRRYHHLRHWRLLLQTDFLRATTVHPSPASGLADSVLLEKTFVVLAYSNQKIIKLLNDTKLDCFGYLDLYYLVLFFQF